MGKTKLSAMRIYTYRQAGQITLPFTARLLELNLCRATDFGRSLLAALMMRSATSGRRSYSPVA
jgi:hypothetical protein